MKKSKKSQNSRIAVTVTVIVVAALAVDYVRKIYLGSGCLFKALFGIACPACGMTRAYTSLLRLDFSAAFYYNPAWWTPPIAAASAALALADKKRAKFYLIIFIADMVALFAVWIYRLANGTTV